jgi:hypothetical protein
VPPTQVARAELLRFHPGNQGGMPMRSCRASEGAAQEWPAGDALDWRRHFSRGYNVSARRLWIDAFAVANARPRPLNADTGFSCIVKQ